MAASKKTSKRKRSGKNERGGDSMRRLNEAHQEIKAAEESALRLDLTESFTEIDRSLVDLEITFPLDGKPFTLVIPPSPTLSFIVFYSAHCTTEVNGGVQFSIPEDMVKEFWEALAGKEQAKVLINSDLNMLKAMALLRGVLKVWGVDVKDGGASGKAQATPG